MNFRAPPAKSLTEQIGFTLVELLIALAIFSLLLALGLPSYQNWSARNKVRVAAESMMGGLVLARNQALQRNTQVHFYMTDSLSSTCALSNTGTSWVVSMESPAGLCNTTPSDTTAPRIIQSRAGTEGGSRGQVSAVNATNTAANRLIFTGLGRIMTTDTSGNDTNPITTLNFTYPERGTCEHAGGVVRCLRILITTGGEARLCDPAVSAATDPRRC